MMGSTPESEQIDINQCDFNRTSACFLCLRESDATKKIFSLRSIYRYLQINCEKDIKGGNISGGGENGQAIICNQCTTIIQPLSKLCTELELLQMRIHHYLKSVNELLDQDSSNHFQDNLGCNETLSDDVELSKLMRKKVQQKCQIELSQVEPKVMLTNDSSLLFKHKILKTEPFDEMENSENYFTETSTPLASDDDMGAVPSNFETSEKSIITKPSFESQTVKNSHAGFQPCNLCNPPTMTNIRYTAQHHIMSHLDNWFLSSKNLKVTQEEFKDYCFYILKIELLSCGIQSSAKGNALVNCQYCSFTTTEGEMHMRKHVCSMHKEIMSAKLVELQRSTTPDELRAIQFPSLLTSSLSEKDADSKRKQYKCVICGKIFLAFASLSKHKITEHKDTAVMQRVWKCSVCDRVFQRHKFFLKHRETHKRSVIKIKCTVCGNEFKNPNSLSQHMKVQHATNAQIHKCTDCDSVFKLRASLLRHIRLDHTKTTPVSVCNLCGKVFKHASTMYAHKAKEHKIDKTMTHENAATLVPQTNCSLEVNTAENPDANIATSTMVAQIEGNPTIGLLSKVRILNSSEIYNGNMYTFICPEIITGTFNVNKSEQDGL